MGRGRAKAKQTKVARALKYGGPQTDLDRLQAELAGGGQGGAHENIDGAEETVIDEPVEDPYAVDPYAKYYDAEDDDSDEESAAR